MKPHLPMLVPALLLLGCGGEADQREESFFFAAPFLNIAHRGGSRLAPEETVVAYRNALEVGADVLELDLHSTSDGVLVCLHDDTVDRTTDGDGEVEAMTFAELAQLDAGYQFTRDHGETYPYRGEGLTIPSLEEVLETFDDHYFIMEIKQVDPPIVDDVIEMLVEHDVTDRVIIASAFDYVVAEVRLAAPEMLTSLGTGEMVSFVTLSESHEAEYVPPAPFLHVPHDGIDAEFLARAHRFDLETHAWTVNDRDEMERLIDLGVEGIMTDDPETLHAVVEELLAPAE